MEHNETYVKILLFSIILLLIVNVVLQVLVYTKSKTEKPKEKYQFSHPDQPCPTCDRWNKLQYGNDYLISCISPRKERCKKLVPITPPPPSPDEYISSSLVYRPDIQAENTSYLFS